MPHCRGAAIPCDRLGSLRPSTRDASKSLMSTSSRSNSSSPCPRSALYLNLPRSTSHMRVGPSAAAAAGLAGDYENPPAGRGQGKRAPRAWSVPCRTQKPGALHVRNDGTVLLPVLGGSVLQGNLLQRPLVRSAEARRKAPGSGRRCGVVLSARPRVHVERVGRQRRGGPTERSARAPLEVALELARVHEVVGVERAGHAVDRVGRVAHGAEGRATHSLHVAEPLAVLQPERAAGSVGLRGLSGLGVHVQARSHVHVMEWNGSCVNAVPLCLCRPGRSARECCPTSKGTFPKREVLCSSPSWSF